MKYQIQINSGSYACVIHLVLKLKHYNFRYELPVYLQLVRAQFCNSLYILASHWPAAVAPGLCTLGPSLPLL